jgi:hypothetical protein
MQGVLQHAKGVENERGTPTFELVNHSTGEWEAWLRLVAASELAGRAVRFTSRVGVHMQRPNAWCSTPQCWPKAPSYLARVGGGHSPVRWHQPRSRA